MIFSIPIHVLIVVLICLSSLQIRAAVASASRALPHVNDCNLCSNCVVDEEPSRKLSSIKDLMVNLREGEVHAGTLTFST
jgi:hypothetical protein